MIAFNAVQMNGVLALAALPGNMTGDQFANSGAGVELQEWQFLY